MLILQDIAYRHPDKELLIDNIDLTAGKHDKIALIGNNGSGKSTLLKIIAGELKPASGHIDMDAPAYYVPQHFGQYNHLTIAQALGVAEKREALKEILEGKARCLLTTLKAPTALLTCVFLIQAGHWPVRHLCSPNRCVIPT